MNTMMRREFLALLTAAVACRSAQPNNADADRPDYITYWLFQFDEAFDCGQEDEALKAARELRAAIEAEGVPKQWRTLYLAAQRL